MNDALVLDRVSKRYASHLAVDELSLRVPAGTIYGILGPNGAGKSTTLRMVMNIIARDGGLVALLGVDPARDRRILRRVGYLPEERGLYRRMLVLDVIIFFARLKGLTGAEARRRGDAWLERMGLGEWRTARVETLSKGMQQKVQFITTVIHEPEVLILDEPHSGLDPVNQEVLRDTILDASRQGRTVVLSTHNMEQAQQMCESVCIIAGGVKVLDGNVRQIRREGRGNRCALAFDGPSVEVERLLRGDRRVRSVEAAPEGLEIELEPGSDPRQVVAAVCQLDVPLTRFEHIEPSLHEIFVQHAGNAATAGRRAEVSHA
jgi:ABC-2 type transport system ATP-binding protein